LNILDFVPALKRTGAAAETTEEVDNKKRHYPKSTGPVNRRQITNGQIRRFQERAAKSAKRKATTRNRRAYLTNELRLAVLRGWVQALRQGPESAAYRGVIDQVVLTYGERTVKYGHASPTDEAKAATAALEHWDSLVAERPNLEGRA
jgi:hypothetical protein